MILSSPDFGQEYIFTIENNMAYLVKGSKLVYEAEVIEAETGLLEVNKVKDEDKDKFRIKTLLRWRIQVGRPVVINSSKLSGQFDVFACKHLCKNKSYYTEFEVVP
jgi:chemotaxis methyl-accepting protein methylase